MIFASPKLFAAQLLQVTFGRAAAFGLQLSFQAEGPPFLFFPSSLAQEVTGGGHGGSVQSQVHADHFLRWRDAGCRKGDHDMKGVAPIAITQVSATGLVPDIRHEVNGNGEGQFDASRDGGEATGQAVPFDPKRTGVIADSRDLTVRTSNRLEGRNGFPLLAGALHLSRIRLLLPGFPGERRCDGLRRFDAGRADQLCRQIGILSTERIVGPFMQLDAIVTSGREPLGGNDVKARRMLLKGVLECACLLRRRIQLDSNGSLHAKSISYIPT